MYADPSAAETIAGLLTEARDSAGTDPRALAAVGMAEANAGNLDSPATAATVLRSLDLARQVEDPLLISAALDVTAMLLVTKGSIARAADIATERIDALRPLARDPRAAFELKDALRTAAYAELAVGQVRRSLHHAEQAYRLPFVREEPDVACEDLLTPAALAGQWDRVAALAEQFRGGYRPGRTRRPQRGSDGNNKIDDTDREITLIARTWRGWISTDRAAAYVEYVTKTGLSSYKKTPGNLGAQTWTRDLGDGRTEIMTVSWWSSRADIEAFAGRDISVAVFYAEDDDYLLDRETTVTHYDVPETTLSSSGNPQKPWTP